MKRLSVILLIAVGSCLATGGFATDATPEFPVVQEFYWDDGSVDGYVNDPDGHYWGVEFGPELTGGSPGTVSQVGAVTSSWPDSTFQGCYLHIFSEYNGQPYEDLSRDYLQGTPGVSYDWVGTDVYVSTGTFYLVYESYGNFPSCDSLGYDTDNSGHSYGGDGWQPLGYELMLRCYWESAGIDTAATTWGGIKTLYR